MRRRVKYVALIFVLGLLVFTYENCGSTKFVEVNNTSTLGNPMTVAMNLRPVTSTTVSNVKVCPLAVTFDPADTSQSASSFSIAPNSLSVGNSKVSLTTVSLPVQAYVHIDLTLGVGGACSNAAQFTNSTGTFNTPDQVKIGFVGAFTVDTKTVSVDLDLQTVIDQLANVTSSSQVDPTLQSTDGQVVLTNAPTFKQLQVGSLTGTGNTIATSNFPQSVTSGNFIICAIYFNSGTQTVTGLTDTNSNSYTRILQTGGAGALAGWKLETWSSAGINGAGTFKVTANFSGTFNGEKDIVCHEYSGVNSANPWQSDANGVAGTGANAYTAPKPAVQTNELMFGVSVFATSGTGAPGFNQRAVFKNIVTEDKSIGAPGNFEADFVNSPMDWITSGVMLLGN